MTAGTVRAAVTATVYAAVLAGCSGGSHGRPPSATDLPLLPGSRVVARATQCDKGANSFCSLELVVVNTRFKTSLDLLNAEHQLVHSHGWRGVTGDTGDERAAESPSHALRLTYGTNEGDLRGIDLGWIHRSRAIAYALARTLFDHSPAMSVMLEKGSA